MEVLGKAWLVLLTALTSCTAAPLLPRAAAPDATTFHPSPPTPIPPTEPVPSANNASQPTTAKLPSLPAIEASTESSHTVSGYNVAMLPPEELEDVTSPFSEEGFLNVQTAALPPSNRDVLDYELSSLKNKPADRLATVPNIPESGTSAAAASEEEMTAWPWESPKTMIQPTEGTPSVTEVSHAHKTPTESSNAPHQGDDRTTPVSATVSTITDPEQTEDKTSFFEASTAGEISKLNTTLSPLQDHSKVQSTRPPTTMVNAFTQDADTWTAATTVPARQPTPSATQGRDSLLQAQTSTTPETGSSEEVDVELQLENLVSTRSPTTRPSTTKPAGGSLFPHDDMLPQATPEKGDDLKSSEVVTDVPSATENSSQGVSTQSTFTESVAASFFPEEEPAEKTTAESLPDSTLEADSIAPVLQSSDDHEEGKTSSGITLAFTDSPDMEKVTADVSTNITMRLVPQLGTAGSDRPITGELSVPTPMQAASTSPVTVITDAPSDAVSRGVPEGEEAQNASYSTSTSEEDAVQVPTEAHDNSDYVSETFQTALSEDSTTSAEALTASSTSQDVETMLTSQSSQDDVVSPNSYRNNETFQITHSGDSTPSFSEPPTPSSASRDLEDTLTSQSSQHDVVLLTHGNDTLLLEKESTTESVLAQSAQNETEAIIDAQLPAVLVTMLNRNFSGDDDNPTVSSASVTNPDTFTSASTSSVAEVGVVTAATTADVTVPAFGNSTGIAAVTVDALENTTFTSLGNVEEMPGQTVSPNETVSVQLLPEQSMEHGTFWDVNETSPVNLGPTEVPSDTAETSTLSNLPALIGQVPTSVVHELTTTLPSEKVTLEESNNFSPSSHSPLSVTDSSRPTAEDVASPPSTHSSTDESTVSPTTSRVQLSTIPEQTATTPLVQVRTDDGSTASTPLTFVTSVPAVATAQQTELLPEQASTEGKEALSTTTTSPSIPTASSPHEAASTRGVTGLHTTPSAPTKHGVQRAPGCVPLEPPRRLTHEFRLVFNTSAKFAWDQVEVLERRIQHFAGDDACPRRFARTAFALGPPHVLSWTDPSVNATWCDRSAVDAFYHTMRTEIARAFYPEFKVVAVELRYRGACDSRRSGTSFPVVATAAVVGVLLSAALVTGLAVLLWRALRLVPSRSRKLNVTRPPSSSAARQQPRESFDLKQRRPILLPGENRAAAAAAAAGTNGTPSKSPHTKPNPPFVVDTDFCYINPNFLEVVKPSPPPPPYRRSLDRRVRSLEAVLPAPPPRPPHGPHSMLGNRSLGRTPERPAEQDEGNSSSSGVESDAQPSGEAKSTESS